MLRKFLVVLIFYIPICSHAITVCKGNIQSVSLNPNGDLLQFNYGYGTQIHCRFSETWNGVTPEMCSAMFSQLLAAQIAEKMIEVRYNDDFICNSENLGNFEKTKHLLYYISIAEG